MNYEVTLTPDEIRRRVQSSGKLPPSIKGAVAQHLDDLAVDPHAIGYVPPFSHPQIGLMSTVRVKHNGRRHVVQFFYSVDDAEKKVSVRRVVITPPYPPLNNPSPTAAAHPVTGPVTQIPPRP